MTQKLILGTRKGLLILEERSSGWEVVHHQLPGVPFSYAMRDHRNGRIWGCADHGHWGQKLYYSDDDGATLNEQAAPRYPEDAKMVNVFAGPDEEKEQLAKVTYLWTIVPGGDDYPERLYIGTEPGGVFRSDDNGQNFYLMSELWDHPSRAKNWFGGGRDQAGACSIIVDPRDNNHLFVGVSIGGVYESNDGGESWEGRNKGLVANYLPNPHAEYGHDPHCLVASPSNPDVLWQQNHCGVFRTTDSGQQWHDISQGDVFFGFPIVVSPTDAETAWVIPALSDEVRMALNGALCVHRTRDGGRTWEQLRNGLPQSNCYDVVFRHAFHLQNGRLVFGSTTGNLFLSEDGGDSWQTLGSAFPPIYSVRFA
ncbi:MAG: glycosyl hydrolase [Chloroflexota bacterium]